MAILTTLPSPTSASAAAPVSNAGARAANPLWLRMNHWVNVVAVLPLVASGWRIYDASPLFPLHIPKGVTLGGWLGGALQWHFAAMWLLFANGLVYLALNLATGRFAGRFFPLRGAAIRRELGLAIRGRLPHDHAGHYNALQRLAYLVVIADLVLLVLSGLVLWKSVQFPLLRQALGGYEAARRVHFFAMALLVGFIAVHLAMVALVPRSLRSMLGSGAGR
jgi:thiosulfate reductase cytochrome b subunit